MSRIWTVCRREFISYFQTPVGYVALGVYALICGLAFVLSLFMYAKVSVQPPAYGYTSIPNFGEALVSPYLVFCGILFMFLSPLITMRLLAEERNRGTLELLLTWPLTDRDIIFGKYLAAVGMLLLMMPVIALHLFLASRFRPLEPAAIALGVATVVLMGLALISLGMFISAVSRSQVVAGTLTFGVNLVMYIAGNVGEKLPQRNPAPEGWPEMLRAGIGAVWELFRGLLTQLPLDAHARDLTLGVARPRDIVYYLLFAAFFLFLTFRAVESRHWRGK